MAQKILVAGATGQLGRALIAELKRRGYHTRALVRDESKLNGARASLDEIVTGDLLKPETLRPACDGVDAIFSCAGASLKLGFSKDRNSYRDVDYRGNKNLLDAAVNSGVKRFAYVSVFGAHLYPRVEYVEAHENFVRELADSKLSYTIIRPTGFFYSFAEILRLANKGAVMSVGAGAARTNPIDEVDLAEVCAHALENEEREVAAGGAETYTRRGIIELAFAALGKKPKIVNAPPAVVKLMAQPLRLFDRRLCALMDFFLAVSQQDVVAPQTGSRSFKEFMERSAHELRDQK